MCWCAIELGCAFAGVAGAVGGDVYAMEEEWLRVGEDIIGEVMRLVWWWRWSGLAGGVAGARE